jgi:hypothetical protein
MTTPARLALASVFTHGKSLLTGCEWLASGDLKCYVGPRWEGIYCLLPPGPDADAVWRAWGDVSQHVLIPTPPPDALFTDKDAR